MSRNDKRGTNFGRMGNMLMNTHDNYNPQTNYTPQQYQDDKPKALSRNSSLQNTGNSKPFKISQKPLDYMPTTKQSFHNSDFGGNSKFEFNEGMNQPSGSNFYANSNYNKTEGFGHKNVSILSKNDDDSVSNKSKPFRIKDHSKNNDFMFKTGHTSTTTSSN